MSFQCTCHRPMASLLRHGLPQMVRRCKPNLITLAGKNSPVIYLGIRRVASSSKKGASAPVTVSEKTPYEIELERLKKKDPEEKFYGFYKDQPYVDKMQYHSFWLILWSLTLMFLFPVLSYTPMWRGNDRKWKAREAHAWIEKRRANDEPLISKDYAPAEIIEGMVPPPGDWERDWLMAQQSVRPSATGVYNHNYTF
ncbi:uncharacterized protein LOC120339369 [Styela clava]